MSDEPQPLRLKPRPPPPAGPAAEPETGTLQPAPAPGAGQGEGIGRLRLKARLNLPDAALTQAVPDIAVAGPPLPPPAPHGAIDPPRRGGGAGRPRHCSRGPARSAPRPPLRGFPASGASRGRRSRVGGSAEIQAAAQDHRGAVSSPGV